MPTNCSDGGVLETTRRFHVASAAFISPAWRPTRGSGLGAVVDMLSTGAGAPAALEWAQAAVDSEAESERQRRERAESHGEFPGGHGELPSEVRAQHRLHPGDLGGLIDVDVVGELEHGLVLGGAVGAEQLLHHGDGALVVLDHEGQEQAVEVGPSRLIQRLHLVFSEHAGHQHHRWRPSHHSIPVGLRHRLAAVAEPALHGRDLVLLGIDDPLGQGAHRWAGAVGGRPAGHHDGLGMVADHAGHEVHVRLGIGMAGAVGPDPRGRARGRITGDGLGGRLRGSSRGVAAGRDRGRGGEEGRGHPAKERRVS